MSVEASHIDSRRTSRVVKRSILVGGHHTSISLEDAFWIGLKQIAYERDVPLSKLMDIIDTQRQHCNLSSAIRIFVFEQRRKNDARMQSFADARTGSVPAL